MLGTTNGEVEKDGGSHYMRPDFMLNATATKTLASMESVRCREPTRGERTRRLPARGIKAPVALKRPGC